MAGLGKKTFVANDVLLAADVNGYLMEQSVMRFADASARSSAILTPTEGMVSYLDDTNKVEVYDGAQWVSISEETVDASPTTRGIVYGFTSESGANSNVALGEDAGSAAIAGGTANDNVYLGDGAGSSSTGDDNIAIGKNALKSSASSDNVVIGSGAAQVASGMGDDNVVIGFGASGSLDSGNVVIGTSAGSNANNAINSVAIGRFATIGTDSDNCVTMGEFATTSSSTATNEITLGASNITTLRCATGSITTFSDRRDKKNIEDLGLGLNLINELKPVKFDWQMRDEGKVDIPDSGFIAQDVIEAEDKLGAHEYLKLSMRNNEDRYEISPSRLIPVLVNAVKELSAEVESLKAQAAKK